MCGDRLHEPCAETLALKCIEDIDIADVREGCPIGDDPGETDLRITIENTEAERIC